MKRISFAFLLGFIVVFLAACATTGGPAASTEQPSSLPPTQALSPTSTISPPTETPTSIPPTPTATSLPANAIQHFPSGQELNITSINMIDATTGWAIGGLGSVGDHVLFTADGGSNWKDVTPPETEPLSGTQKTALGFFQDAKTAWVTYGISGGNPVPTQVIVWRTSDGGASWQASPPLDLTGLSEIYYPSDMQFVAGQNGWLLAHVGVGMMHDYVVIYHSTDGGASWTRIIDPYIDGGIQSCSKTAMVFTDATHGWLTGDCHGVKGGVLLFNSTDAGVTWKEVTLPDPTGAANLYEDENNACGSYDPFFFGNDMGHLSVTCTNFSTQQTTNKYYIYTTQDGGSTWTGSAYPGEGLYFFSADTGWALANKIQLTTDGGVTWKPVSDVTWTPQMDFISEQIGWAVARSPDAIALVKTDNGGARWTELTPSIGP
jgi:photosystem II stability/assembly factor-like uncharacterized protein